MKKEKLNPKAYIDVISFGLAVLVVSTYDTVVGTTGLSILAVPLFFFVWRTIMIDTLNVGEKK